MFKNAILYRIVSLGDAHLLASTLEDKLHGDAFVECGATQEKSSGWVSPRGELNGLLVESVGGQWILKHQTEVKVIPAAVIKRKVEEQSAAIEASTGRKPGKKERRELTDDARLSLLPMAFTKTYATTVWINHSKGFLLIDASSQGKADEVITALVKAIDGLAIQLINTNTSPAASMAIWLSTKEAPFNFSVDRECELKANDESKAVVKYGRHALDTDEVVQHIALGKMPTKLAMTWNDRVSFVLTEGLQLKKIVILDVAMETGGKSDAADAFDADVAIATAELESLVDDLLPALGGEVQATPQV